jgi:hypothetical protein
VTEPPQIVVQLRLEVPTECDLLAPSCTLAAALNPWEARLVADELLRFVAAHPAVYTIVSAGTPIGRPELLDLLDRLARRAATSAPQTHAHPTAAAPHRVA